MSDDAPPPDPFHRVLDYEPAEPRRPWRFALRILLMMLACLGLWIIIYYLVIRISGPL